MLISHDYKFIFIKPKKVAGSSIQAYLAKFCKNGVNYHRDPKSHMRASEVKEMVGEEIWNSYKKITVVRNPWDKTVSLYFWRKRSRALYIHIRRVLRGKTWMSPAQTKTFKEYVSWLQDQGKVNVDYDITFINDELPDYYFIRFEHMHEDLEKVCGEIGVTYNPDDMPQKKVGHRKDKGYQQHYDEETQEYVRAAYAEEIKRFGYTF